ncbi:hypothetical protein C8R43DRAFT_1141000 [Mycena crocata]|nr:hypothetical protein C8R43DRAFT_1141000 [Mycena crocata]
MSDNLAVPTSDPFETEFIGASYSQRDETSAQLSAGLGEIYAKREARHAANLASVHSELDIDLLRVQFNDMEVERDNAQEEAAELHKECISLREENAKLKAELDQYKRSLKFFQKETGRWRWAAAHAHTRIQTAMREFRGAMEGASEALRHP